MDVINALLIMVNLGVSLLMVMVFFITSARPSAGLDKMALILAIVFLVNLILRTVIELVTGRYGEAIFHLVLLAAAAWILRRRNGKGKKVSKVLGEKAKAARQKLLDALTPPEVSPSPA